jgi:hypothetical protein
LLIENKYKSFNDLKDLNISVYNFKDIMLLCDDFFDLYTDVELYIKIVEYHEKKFLDSFEQGFSIKSPINYN